MCPWATHLIPTMPNHLHIGLCLQVNVPVTSKWSQLTVSTANLFVWEAKYFTVLEVVKHCSSVFLSLVENISSDAWHIGIHISISSISKTQPTLFKISCVLIIADWVCENHFQSSKTTLIHKVWSTKTFLPLAFYVW